MKISDIIVIGACILGPLYLSACTVTENSNEYNPNTEVYERIEREEAVLYIPEAIATQCNRIVSVWREGNYGEVVYLEGGEKWQYTHFSIKNAPHPPLSEKVFKQFFANWSWNGTPLKNLKFNLLAESSGIVRISSFKVQTETGETRNCLSIYRIMARSSAILFGFDCRDSYLLTGDFMDDFADTSAEFGVKAKRLRRSPSDDATRVAQ